MTLFNNIEKHIESFNTSAKEHGQPGVEWTAFKAKLVAAGYVNDATLTDLSVEELREMGLPTPLAKSVLRLCAAPPVAPVEIIAMTQAERVAGLPLAQLVAGYDPRKKGPYAAALFDKAACVVFKGDGSVDVEVTAKLVDEVERRK